MLFVTFFLLLIYHYICLLIFSARVPAPLALYSHKCLGRLQVFQKNKLNNSFYGLAQEFWTF